MEKYYALINDYRDEESDIIYTKVLCVSLCKDVLKTKIKEYFSQSCKDAKEMLGTEEDLEIHESDFCCSIQLAFRYDEFHDEYTIHEVELGII